MFDFMRKKKDVLSEVSSMAHDQVSLFTPLRSGGRLISQAQEVTPYFYYVACRPSWSIKGTVASRSLCHCQWHSPHLKKRERPLSGSFTPSDVRTRCL